MPKLVISGTVYELADELITIGRAPDNLIVIEDPSVSGRHAEIRLVGEAYHLKDRGSTNGTRVNGIPITETALRFDDRIHFGAIDARYEPDTRGSQPLPHLQEIEANPAESSATPVDFANASPFPRRRQQTDSIGIAILTAAVVAFVALLGSMIAVLSLHAPSL